MTNTVERLQAVKEELSHYVNSPQVELSKPSLTSKSASERHCQMSTLKDFDIHFGATQIDIFPTKRTAPTIAAVFRKHGFEVREYIWHSSHMTNNERMGLLITVNS